MTAKPGKAVTFRGIKVKLECGCFAVISTSFYRISAVRYSLLIGSHLRSGIWCFKCGGTCAIISHHGTVNLEES